MTSSAAFRATGTAQGWYGDSNTEFDVDGPSTSVLKNGQAINTRGDSAVITGPTPYSLTTSIHVDVLTRGTDPIQNLQVSANLSAVGEITIPEPSCAMLLGTTLLGRRRHCSARNARSQRFFQIFWAGPQFHGPVPRWKVARRSIFAAEPMLSTVGFPLP